jgi:hypothetical protein
LPSLGPNRQTFSPFEAWEYYIDDDMEMTNRLCAQRFKALCGRGSLDTGFSCESEDDDAMIEQAFEQVEGGR